MATVIQTYTPRQPLEIGGGRETGGVTGVPAQVLSGFGSALADLASGWQAMQPAQTHANFQAFQLEENKLLNKSMFETKPDTAQGYAERYGTEFGKRRDDWLSKNTAGMTPKQQAAYAAQMSELETGIYGKTIGFERERAGEFALAQLDKSVQEIYIPRAQAIAALPDNEDKPLEFHKLIADTNAAIDANPALSETDKFKQKEAVAKLAALNFAKSLPLTDQSNLNPLQAVDTVSKRITAVEGTAKNPRSSAVGKGQFIDDTWVDMLKRYRPALTEGKSRDEILALRTDPRFPDLGETMVKAYATENAAFLKTRGLPVTAGNLYLAHFLGPKGAADMLAGDPSQAAADLNPAAAKANPSVFYAPGDDGRPDLSQPRSVADLQGWAGALMSGTKYTDWGPVLKQYGVKDEELMGIALGAGVAITKQQTDATAAAKLVYDTQLNTALNRVQDGSFGLTELDGATKTWLTDATDRAKVRDAITKYQGDNLKLARDTALVADTSRTIDAFDPKQKASVNNWYETYGDAGKLLDTDQPSGPNDGPREPSAQMRLRFTIQRTGMVPNAAVSQIKSGMASPDTVRRDRAFTILDAIQRANPPAAAEAFTAEDLKRLDIYQQLQGIVPPEILAEELNPMQSTAAKKLRDERMAEGRKIAAQDSATDATYIATSVIEDAFDPGMWETGPSAPRDPQMLGALRRDFETEFALAYSRVPDKDKAQAMALKWLKMKWGPTTVGSGNTIMPYPPERKYPAINGSHSWMDDQLAELVEKEHPGSTDYWIMEAPLQTEADVNAGIPPSYLIGGFDKDGIHFVLGPDPGGTPARFDIARAQREEMLRIEQMRAQKMVGDALKGAIEGAPPEDTPAGRFMTGTGRKQPPPPSADTPLGRLLSGTGR